MDVRAGLVGRETELRSIDDLVARAADGGGALLIHGEAGIGKSALLDRASELARAAGTRVLRTTGVRTETNLPFAGLHQLLRPVLPALETLPGPQRSALAGAFGMVDGAADDPFLIAMGALTLLADAAAESPILAVVDDAQWVDGPSMDALAFVARRLGSDPIAMLFADRDGEPSHLDGAGIEELRLAPLDETEGREIVATLAPSLEPRVRDRIVREAAGNPLALVELSRSVPGEVAPGEAMPELLPLTDRLERVFADSARDLPEDTRWLLLVAALDDHGEIPEILEAAGVPEAAFAPAVDSRLVEIDQSTVRFRHPLVRSAIQQRASRQERQRAHLALARVVADVDRVAWHRAAATDLPDESVAALLDAAADRAIRRGAFAVAVSAIRRAAIISADGRARGTRLLRAAEVANDLGRMDVIGQMLAEAEPIDVPDLEARRQAWLTALSLTGPRSPREEANLRSVVAAARRVEREGDPDLGLDLLQFASARSWWLDPGVEIRSAIADAARALVPEPDDPRFVFIGAIAPEDHLDGLLERLAERARSPEPITGTEGRRYGTAALWLGALDHSVDSFTAGIASLRQEGRLGLLARSLVIRAFSSVHVGSLATVASDLDEGFRIGLETRQPFYQATARVAEAMYLAFRGDIEGAEASLAKVERVVVQAPADAVLAEARIARGIVDLAAGRHDEAWEDLRHLFEADHPSHHVTVRGWGISDLADAAVATDHVEEALEIVNGLEADPVRIRMPWWRIGLAYARAVLASHRDDAAAEAAFESARAMDLDRWPLARARLTLAWGVWLRRQRRAAEARAELRSARDLLDAVGIRFLADRARQELGASGEASRHRAFDAFDQLTPQELQIARLAADGLSNREIGSRLYLSHRTVGSHLYRAYPKLGVSSRAQLHKALR